MFCTNFGRAVLLSYFCIIVILTTSSTLLQKGCGRGQFGYTDQLLLNTRIWHQVKSNNRSLSVALLDYRKAYDAVPHNWILCCLKMFRFHPTILQCIGHLLALWNTTLFLRMPNRDPVKLATVSIRYGIFQGDTLSPLLFR